MKSMAKQRTQLLRSALEKRRDDGGFTMVETLAVVAIIVILLGFGFVALWQTRISMTQLEVDSTAREIYIAAQNHLTAANAQGFLDEDSGIKLGELEGSSDSDGIRYFVYKKGVPSDNVNSPQNKGSVLGLMLPFASIDETVRAGGSYIIRYDPKTVTVRDVFFAKDDNNFGSTSFTTDDYYKAGFLDTYAGESNASNRRDFKGGIIGWYNGDGGSFVELVDAPRIKVTNSDVLKVEVSHPDCSKAGFKLVLEVTGKESKAFKSFELVPSASPSDQRVSNSDANTYTVVLDDVTKSQIGVNRHFCALAGNGGELFKPGEDLEVKAWATFTSDTVKNGVGVSASITTNSLFASGKQISGNYNAVISSVRHLENLSNEISGFPTAAVSGVLGPQSATEITVVNARQTRDLSLTEFFNSSDTSSSIINKDGGSDGESLFIPVNPQYKIVYNGNTQKISDVKVNHSGYAGLFGGISIASSEIKNLQLVDFDITATEAGGGAVPGYAGALAGGVNPGVAVSNVLAYDSKPNVDKKNVTGWVAGGLVGLVNSGDGSVAVNSSAAALYVHATNGAAGGLIGEARGSLQVKDSYSGGHTVDGLYPDPKADGTVLDVVSDGGAAGGLVGFAASLEAQYCYSTCSVKGKAYTGGLVGQGAVSNEGVKNCYATGLVVNDNVVAESADDPNTETDITIGAFAGSLTGGAISDNHYFDIINYMSGVKAIAGQDVDGVSAFDANANGYNDFVGGSTGNAIPYDARLQVLYQGKYPLPTIKDLDTSSVEAPQNTQAVDTQEVTPFIANGIKGSSGLSAANETKLRAHLVTHYGDWPAPETLVVNESSGSGA